MDEILTDRLLLRQMTIGNAEAICAIYNQPEISTYLSIEPLSTQQQQAAFIKRIITACNYIWTIRLSTNPEIIIGDCALHHLQTDNRTMEIGGTLSKTSWGKGLMAEAFSAVIQFAITTFDLQYIIGKTNANNVQAIRCVQKLGFQITETIQDEVYLTKKVDT